MNLSVNILKPLKFNYQNSSSNNSINNNSLVSTTSDTNEFSDLDKTDWTWKEIRQLIGSVIPPLVTMILAIASLFSSPVLTMAEAITGFLNWTSLFIIASDLPSIFEGVLESIEQIKEVFLNPSFKGFLYVLSKTLPLYFIAEVFAGKNLISRMVKGETWIDKRTSLFHKFASNKPFHFGNFVSLTEALKAQCLNLGGDSIARTALWYIRRGIIQKGIAPLTMKFYHGKGLESQKQKSIESLTQAVVNIWLTTSSNLLSRVQYQ